MFFFSRFFFFFSDTQEGQKREAWVEANKQNLTVLPWHATNAVAPSHGTAAALGNEIGRMSGTPEEHRTRKAFISRPARAAASNGSHQSRHWRIEFENQERWTNQLMGYQSSADPLGRTQVRFETKDAAIAFARKMGWDYDVLEANDVRSLHGTKGYYQNFLNFHVEARQKAQSAARFARGQFAHAERGKTAFVNLKHTKYGGQASKMGKGTHWQQQHPNNHSAATWRNDNLRKKQELARKLGK